MTHEYLQPTKLNWLYIDLNSYFATIEQQVDPALRNKPVVVVPVLSDATCAIAASIEAKRKGIRTGTKIYEAKKLCLDLICVIAKHELYVKYHQKIFKEVDKYLYVDHIFSIDEGACRLTGKCCDEETAIKLAKQIKAAIKKNVGEYINCSIGIAPNRYLAKIATDMQKPDGLIVIRPGDIPNKLFLLKLTDLPGVGCRTFNRLTTKGITTVKQLCQLDPKLLRKIWGNVWGEKIWYLLRGADLPVEATKSSSISHSQVLAPELRNPDSARNVALSLLLRGAQRLRARALFTSSIILVIKMANYQSLKSAVRLKSTSDSFNLSNALLECWDKLGAKLELFTASNLMIKKVAINLCNLESQSQQLSFGDLSESSKKDSKKQLLSQSMDKLNAKYGHNTVSLGQIPKKNNKTPVVAFGYIPEV